MAPLRSLGNTASIFDDFYGRTGKDAATNPFVHSYWFATLSGNGSDDDEPYGIAVDSENSVYVTGFSESHGFGDKDALIAKFDSLGTLQWQTTLGGSAGDRGRGIAVDSSDNIYITGESSTNGLIAKYSSSGSLLWQRVLIGGTTAGYSVAVDSSDNVYICGRTTSGAGAPLFIAKYDSSGTLQGQRFLGVNTATNGYGVAIDGSDNVYVFGDTDGDGAGDLDMLIAKYNSSLSIQWQRTLGDSVKEEGYGCDVDSSGNVYVSGFTQTDSNTTTAILAKYNTSGDIQWQRSLSTTNKYAIGYAIAVDDTGNNVYVGGVTNKLDSGNSYDVLIAKYNSSGTLQWQRTFGTNSSERLEGIFVKDNVVYACARTGIPAKYLIIKIPADGSLTGTYDGGNYVYQSSSLTSATSGLTNDESTLTDGAGGFTSDSNTNCTNQASTFSSSSDPIE